MKKVVKQREALRGAVLKVSRIPDISLRPVSAWPNRDKLTSSWLQCLPGPDGLSNQALALLLCMSRPACQDRVGSTVGKSTIDIFGDRVMSEILPGDHWRTSYDRIKMAIHSLCIWARVPVIVEMWGLFSHGPSWTPKWTLKLTLRGRFWGTLPDRRPSRVPTRSKLINFFLSIWTLEGPWRAFNRQGSSNISLANVILGSILGSMKVPEGFLSLGEKYNNDHKRLP